MADSYEKRHRAALERRAKQIEDLYDSALIRLARIASQFHVEPGAVVDIAEFPELERELNSVVSSLKANIGATMRAGIMDSWELSTVKNVAYIDQRFGIAELPENIQKIVYDPMRNVAQKFMERKREGLNLSSRVWQVGEQARAELQGVLELGIMDGRGAKTMLNDIKKYLNDPDKMWRRIRDERGNLVMPRGYYDYHPGQGVYRSSRANALRLVRTEINMAYRKADQTRWKGNPMIVGYSIELSEAHSTPDFCEEMVGDYPKDFIFVGWHPACYCVSRPIFMTDEEFAQYQKRPINSNDISYVKYVADIPEQAKNWISDNAEKIDSSASTPYWVTDNFNAGQVSNGLKFQ